LEFDNKLNVDSKTLDLVSKYRADYTGIHLLHYDYVNSDKKDSKSDNDIFWILAFGKYIPKELPVMGLDGTLLGTSTVINIYVTTGQMVQENEKLFELRDNTVTAITNFVRATKAGVIKSINVSVGQSDVTSNTILGTIEYTEYVWQAIKGDRISNIQGLEGGGYCHVLLWVDTKNQKR
jgi:hypothetical protein